MKFVAGLLVASPCCLKGHEPFETSSMVLVVRSRAFHHHRGATQSIAKREWRWEGKFRRNGPSQQMHQQNAGSLGPPLGSEPPDSGVPTTATRCRGLY